MTTKTETNRILCDDELASVSGGSCPRTNGDNPFVKMTMEVARYTYLQAKYFGGTSCP
jgi:hypothetical protein